MESKYLYHYCKLAVAIEFILPEKQLLLNPLGKTNDPRENKSFVFAGTDFGSDDNVHSLREKDSIISNEIRRDCKMLCLSIDHNPYFGYELSRMWALYGDNHKGVCIQLDKQMFLEENDAKVKSGFLRKVNYFELDVTKPIIHSEVDHGRIRAIGLTKYIKEEFRPRNIDHLFFTKNKEWESEREMRFLYINDEEEREYCKIQKSLAGIYLGVDFNDQYLPAIKAQCNGIAVHKLEYRDVRLSATIRLA